MVRRVALLAVVPDQPLRRAVALARLRVAVRRLPVALARLALAPVDRVAPVPLDAVLTLVARRQVPARQARARVGDAARVPVALAQGTRGEVPPVRRARARWQRVRVEGGTRVPSGHTLAEARLGAVVAPAASRVVAALGARRVEAALGVLAAIATPALAADCRPLAALTVGEARRVRVLVDAAALVLAPNALLLGTVETRRVFGTDFLTLDWLRGGRGGVGRQGVGDALGVLEAPPTIAITTHFYNSICSVNTV